ncbi:MAG: hypothetical protein KM310_10485 [Clostridiales bacterium]|nr:hypothetical protein [Clostridiales bacterium]
MNLPKGMTPPIREAPENPPAPPLLETVATALAAINGALAAEGLVAIVERVEADAAVGRPRIALVIRLEQGGGERP